MLLRRYLAAFGPASVADAQIWPGLTRLGEVAVRLRDELRPFRNEAGRELLDHPGRRGPRRAAARRRARRVAEEGARLLAFTDAGATSRDIRFAGAS